MLRAGPRSTSARTPVARRAAPGGFVPRLLARRRADPAAAVDRIAAVAERLAALLGAGLAPAAAWRNVALDAPSSGSGYRRGHVSAAPSSDDAVLAAAADAAARGDDVAAAIDRVLRDRPEAAPAWSVLAAAWSVAEAAGSPLAACLTVLAGSLRDEAQLRRDARAALAGPAASSRLVAALPVIALVFGATLGFDTVGVLFATPIGLGCLAAGAGLLWAGARWNRALIARATVSRPAPGLELDLLAVAMASGASLARAQQIVDAVLRRHLPEVVGADSAAPVIALAERAGAPVADLLRAEAARLRGTARAEGAIRAAALGVRLMIPLGCCVLPAFVLLGVAPLLVSVITGTLGGSA
ncbi:MULTISPECIES: type II secretion system F family protein [unclassified Agromyces]|uniref:type II secretion system F family protein n=1 Tax=unclassified Agromyces TaxID=2639701 RepID=UPI003014C1BB